MQVTRTLTALIEPRAVAALIAVSVLCRPAWSQQDLQLPPLPELPGGPVITDCPPADVQDELFKPMERIPGSFPETQAGPTPVDCSDAIFEGISDRDRFEVNEVLFWQPTNMMYRPTYFDDVPLERYGQSICPHLQPVISGARFFGTVPLLPYKMGYLCPHECISDAGLYRPGSPAPCMRERLPFTVRGALYQAAAVTGAAVAIP
jgi:hypothetical protein